MLELFVAAGVEAVPVIPLVDFVVLECHKPLQVADGRDQILSVVKVVANLVDETVVELDLLVSAVPYAVDLFGIVQLVAE